MPLTPKTEGEICAECDALESLRITSPRWAYIIGEQIGIMVRTLRGQFSSDASFFPQYPEALRDACQTAEFWRDGGPSPRPSRTFLRILVQPRDHAPTNHAL